MSAKRKTLRTTNSASSAGAGDSKRNWLTVKNLGANGYEMLIYGQIGKDWWSNDGIAATEFTEELNKIPAGQPICVRIHSQGGNIYDGLLIYNRLNARKQDVTCVNDGIAYSVASWILLAGKRAEVSPASLTLIHNPSCCIDGDAEDLRAAADFLDTNKAVIVGIYSGKCGKSDEEISAAMDAETVFTAEQAMEWGLCDAICAAPKEAPSMNCIDLSRFRNKPAAQNTKAAGKHNRGTNPTNTVNKEKIIALLNKAGVKVANDASEETLLAELAKLGVTPPAPEPKNSAGEPKTAPDNSADIADIRAQLAAQRRERITNEVQNCVNECRIPVNQKDAWIARAIKDETVLNELRALPQNKPGVEPLNSGVVILAEDLRNLGPEIMRNNGYERAVLITKNRTRLIDAVNAGTNTIDAALQRVTILAEIMRTFAKRLLPVSVFSTKFERVPLQGTAEVVVPYFALQSAASTDFSSSYAMGDTASSMKKVTVNKRKYQAMSFTSAERARQPLLNTMQLSAMNAEKLAYDVFADILSLVVASNYATAGFTGAASAFDLSSVADLKNSCKLWPTIGRGLVLDSSFDASLLKDGFVIANPNGTGASVQEGAVTPRLMGFDYFECPSIPDNSEYLVGFAVHKAAALVATAPITPTDDVMRQLTAYDVVVDPQTGMSFEYRRWGNPDYDNTREVIECNYGYVKADTTAIKRIITQ